MYFLLPAVLSLLPASYLQEESKENPLLTVARESLPDSTKPFTLVVMFKVKEGNGPKFEAAVGRAVKATTREKGNLAYELNRSAKGSNYIIYERWENLAALEAHLKSSHFTKAMAEVDPLIEGALEVHLFVLVPPPPGN